MALPTATQFGAYEVRALIGTGGMGEVYRATDTRLGRDVALKVLPEAFAADPERLARFEREAKLLASLNHSNIAHVYGFERATLPDASGVHFLAMELVEGEDLAERLERGPIPVDEALAIAKQIAEALEEAHEKGIVHRDLKPANIKRTHDGKVKVLDFGLAKAYSGDTASGSSADLSHSPTLAHTGTGAGLILGTAGYMSPEQARGRRVDKRTDIWAFGVVLVEMLTGKRLFAGETVSDTLAAVLRQDVDWKALPETTPPAVRQVLRRCLEREPKRRLRDIGDVRLLLEEGFADPTGVSEALPRRATTSLWQRGAPWAVAGLALVAAGALALRGGASAPGEARGYRFTLPWASLVLQGESDIKGDDFRPAAISPDGRHLTYVAQERLWLRSLDRADPVSLEGTEGASEPFWSPDSRQVAFFAAGSTGNTLKKIGIGGSPAERLAEVPAGWATGSWSRNGAILMEVTESADHDGWYLMRPGATTMTEIRAFPKERPISPDRASPHFLPDGVHFLFTHPLGGEAFLQIGSTDSEETRALVRADSRAAYAAPGFVLYVRDGALLAQPFDARTLRMTGEPQRLLDDVAFFAPTGNAAFSVSQQGTLVLRHRKGPSRLAWLDRDGRETGTLLGPDLYGSLKLSPDGRRLAVSINDPRNGSSDIWLVDIERMVPSRLTSSPRGEFVARWSPDGRSLAFSADWQGPPNIYLQNLDGGSPRVLVPFDRKQHYPWAWTPDGRQLVYAVRDEVSKDDLWITDRAGQDRHRLLATPFEETQAALSPDGRFMAFTSDVTGAAEIYLQSFPGGESRVRVSTGGGFSPRWRGDGRELFYLTRSGQLMALPFAGGGSPALAVALPRPLFHFNGDAFRDYDAAPDGQRFLFSMAGPRAPDEVVVGWTRLLGAGPKDHEARP